MTRKAKADSVFTPVAKGDYLSSIRVYQRTADPHDKRAIVVANYKRANRDLAKASGTYHLTDTQYVKIGAAPFSVHTDADGPLFFDNTEAHFRAWLKLGITGMSVSAMSDYHASPSMKVKGINAQALTVATKDLRLTYTRHSLCGDFWETHEKDSPVFACRSAFTWGERPIVWVNGETLDAIVSDQAAALREMSERQERRMLTSAESKS